MDNKNESLEIYLNKGHHVNLAPIGETEGECAYGYPSTEFYVRLGIYLEQLFGNDTRDKKILDLGCGVGGGVLYLRDKHGIDARGIDHKLTRLWEELKWVKNHKQFERVKELHKAGILIEDIAQNVDQHFQPEEFDALTCVYFSSDGSNDVTVVNPQKSIANKLYDILKVGSFELYVMMDSSGCLGFVGDEVLLHIPLSHNELFDSYRLWTMILQKTK